MTTETEAREIHAAIQAFQKKDSDARNAQNQAELATAQAWFNALPLTWRSSQSPSLQFRNSLVDRMALEAMSESRIRMVIIRKEIQLITERITTIKEAL